MQKFYKKTDTYHEFQKLVNDVRYYDKRFLNTKIYRLSTEDEDVARYGLIHPSTKTVLSLSYDPQNPLEYRLEMLNEGNRHVFEEKDPQKIAYYFRAFQESEREAFHYSDWKNRVDALKARTQMPEIKDKGYKENPPENIEEYRICARGLYSVQSVLDTVHGEERESLRTTIFSKWKESFRDIKENLEMALNEVKHRWEEADKTKMAAHSLISTLALVGMLSASHVHLQHENPIKVKIPEQGEAQLEDKTEDSPPDKKTEEYQKELNKELHETTKDVEFVYMNELKTEEYINGDQESQKEDITYTEKGQDILTKVADAGLPTENKKVIEIKINTPTESRGDNGTIANNIVSGDSGIGEGGSKSEDGSNDSGKNQDEEKAPEELKTYVGKTEGTFVRVDVDNTPPSSIESSDLTDDNSDSSGYVATDSNQGEGDTETKDEENNQNQDFFRGSLKSNRGLNSGANDTTIDSSGGDTTNTVNASIEEGKDTENKDEENNQNQVSLKSDGGSNYSTNDTTTDGSGGDTTIVASTSEDEEEQNAQQILKTNQENVIISISGDTVGTTNILVEEETEDETEVQVQSTSYEQGYNAVYEAVQNAIETTEEAIDTVSEDQEQIQNQGQNQTEVQER